MSDAGATILAAGIGATITLVGLMVSKENKVSEFRQQWIDGLRADISSFIGTATMLCRGVLEKEKKDELLLRLGELDCRIRLRFKPNDPDVTKFIEALNGASAHSLPSSDPSAFIHYQTMLRDEAQGILRREWLKVRRGERKYRAVLWSAVVALCGSIVVVLDWLLHQQGIFSGLIR